MALGAPLDFGRWSALAQPLKPLSVGVKFGAMVDQVTVEPLGSCLRAEVACTGPDGRYQLVVAPAGTFAVGRLETAVLLRAKLASGEERVEQIPVSGSIVRDVEPSPPAYPGGGRSVGESFEFDVALSSATQSPFTVVGVKAVGDGLSAAPRDGGYVVRQKCLAEGVQSGRIEFEVEAADGRYTTSVAVDYTGFQP